MESGAALRHANPHAPLANVVSRVRQDAGARLGMPRQHVSEQPSSQPGTASHRTATIAEHLGSQPAPTDRASTADQNRLSARSSLARQARNEAGRSIAAHDACALTAASGRLDAMQGFDGPRVGLDRELIGARLRGWARSELHDHHDGPAEADRAIEGDTPRKRSDEQGLQDHGHETSESFERGRHAHAQRDEHVEDDRQEAGLATSGAATSPAKPPLAARPSLEQQLANLRHLQDWDDTTSALLKMVAGKWHSDGVALSAGSDNDRFLEKLNAFDWQNAFRAAPADLRQFAQEVAAELECHPHDYQAVLDGASASAEAEPARAPDNEWSASRVLSNLAWNVIHKVVEKAIIEALPIVELKAFPEIAKELRSIYTGNYTPQRKLEELGGALERLGQKLTARGSESWAIPRTLKGYLDVVTPWLRSVSAQWASVELGIDEVRGTESMLGKAQGVLDVTEKLLADRQLASVVAADTLSGLVQGVGAIRQTLAQVQLWQALPGDAHLDDYLGIVAENPLVKKLLDESTLKLGQVLAQVQRYAPYPGNGPLSARLDWLAHALVAPELREQVQQHLAMVLGDEPANQLFALFQLVEQLRHFPADSSLGAQGLWLLSMLNQYGGDMPALAWLNQFQAALGADPATVSLVNRLLTFSHSSGSRRSLMHDLSKAVAPSLGELAVRQVGERFLPTAMARELEKFYQESSATESWSDLFQRLANSALAIAKPYAASALMKDPLAAVTVQYAEALQKHTSWEETLRWFAAHDPSQDKTLQFVYGQYLNAMLAWQVYQALNSGDPNETEDKLRQLARQMKDYQLVKSYPQLEKLIDLMPLLPALREAQKTVKAQPSADSWLGWVQQWLEALADSRSPSLVKLRDDLSRKVETWLADGMMSAFDAAAQLPSRLLPGAAAASVPQETTAAGGTSAPSTAASGLGANWELGAGIGLEALGVAAIGYALWQWRQAGKTEAEPSRDIEMQNMLGPRPAAAQPQTETATFLRPEAADADTVASVGTPSWRDQKLPLLMGLAGVGAMAAGGKFLYDWASSRATVPDGLSDSEYQRELKILQELQVPSLDFLFYGGAIEEVLSVSESAATARQKIAITTTEADETTLAVQHASRIERNAQFSSASIPQLIASATTEANLNNSNIVSGVFSQVDASSDVVSSRSRPATERNVIYLLKSIEYISTFIEAIGSEQDRQRYRPLLDGLWRIADGLTDDYGRTKVEQYKQAFLIQRGPQQSQTIQAVSTTTTAPMEQEGLADSIKEFGERTLRQLEGLYDPILNPVAFIDNYINEGIRSFAQSRGISLSVNPDSPVRIRATHVINSVGPQASVQTDHDFNFRLRDIVTGHYLYQFKSGSMDTWRPLVADSTIRDLVESLDGGNRLPDRMNQALLTYRNTHANRANLTSHYQNMIRMRCLAYLDSPNKVPAYERAVEKFLAGEVQAKEVCFKGAKLSGVFFIPLDAINNWNADREFRHPGGLILSVDEPTFFHASTASASVDDFAGNPWTAYYPAFPNTAEFRAWALTKLSNYEAQKYKNSTEEAFGVRRTYGEVPDPSFATSEVRRLELPFTFAASSSQVDLANRLFDGLMDRVDSDIDTLVFTDAEQVTEATLEMAKNVIMAVSMVLAPVTGSTLIARVGLCMANLALDAAYVTIAATQAQTADRPEDAAAYRNEAIIAGVVAGLIGVASGAPLARQALALYRQTKAASGRAIPSLLKNMNWERLTDGRKIDTLVDTMRRSDQAGDLTRLTSADAVEQSIRRNLTLDGLGDATPNRAWGDFAFEQAQAQRRLNSDLARLNDAKGHLGQFLEQPSAVPRVVLEGVPEEAAAGWIVSRSRSASAGSNAAELRSRVRNALTEYQQADLLDINTHDSIHNAVYAPPQGQAARTFRSSSDPTFMGSDIARAGFERALNDIRIKVREGHVDLGEALYAAITRYHPYGDGNGRTARTVYALAQLKKGQPRFMAPNIHGEDILNPPGPLGRTARGEQLRVIDGQPSVTLPDEMRPYLSELQSNPSINNRMLRPAENCEAILPDVARFMQNKGMQNIQYRGMFIWSNGMDSMPSTHFVALGSKNGETYVFDLTAAQFANRGMSSLDGPLILPEAAWAQRYQNAATTKLMKYKDFDNLSDARVAFGPTQRPLPTDPIEGGHVLAEPRWYKSKRAENSLLEASLYACAGGRRAKRALCDIIDIKKKCNTIVEAQRYYESPKLKEVRDILEARLGAQYAGKKNEIPPLLHKYQSFLNEGNDAFKNLTVEKLASFLEYDINMSDVQKKYMTLDGWRSTYKTEVSGNLPAKYWNNPAQPNAYPVPQDLGQIAIYRTMNLDEANGILGGDLRALDGHMGDLKQAASYYSDGGRQVVMKFTFGPGRHLDLFSPDYLAIAPSGEGAGWIHGVVQNRAPAGRTIERASINEGRSSGYIGVKSESRGERFSFGVSDRVGRDKLKSLLEGAEVIHGPDTMKGRHVIFNRAEQVGVGANSS
ncbi:hypothetical protein WJ64_03735 [Burkholderia ubonensis]|nr:hypothetical protein WJ64_03735 [Burkholderia ubonensis]